MFRFGIAFVSPNISGIVRGIGSIIYETGKTSVESLYGPGLLKRYVGSIFTCLKL